jgi:hypothetical protein
MEILAVVNYKMKKKLRTRLYPALGSIVRCRGMNDPGNED